MRTEDTNKKYSLQKEAIDIVYCKDEINCSLLLSTFFETCGIFSRAHELNYLPNDYSFSKKSIFIGNQEKSSDERLPLNCVSLIKGESTKEQDFSCSSFFELKTIQKFLEHLGNVWELPQSEINELIDLAGIFVANDIWRSYWVGRQQGNSYDEEIANYIHSNARNVHETLKKLETSMEPSYAKHMLLFSEYLNHSNRNLRHMEGFSLKNKYFEKTYVPLFKNREFNYPAFGYLVYKHGVELVGHTNSDASDLKSIIRDNHAVSSELYYLYALYYGQSYGDPTMQYFQKAYKMDPGNYKALYQISKYYLKMNQNGKDAFVIYLYYIDNLKQLLNISPEQYTDIDQPHYYLLALRDRKYFYDYFTCDLKKRDECCTEIKQAYHRIMEGKAFEYLFRDMTLLGKENECLEKKVKARLKRLVNNYYTGHDLPR